MDPLQIWVRNMDRKKEIRAKILKMRQALPKEEVREKSLRIMRRIEETETFKNADNLLAYIDFRGEVETGTLIEKAWELGKKVYVPRVAEKEMEFYRIHSFEDLEKGAYGILELMAFWSRKKNALFMKPKKGRLHWQSCREVFLMKKRTVSVMAVDFMIVILKNGKISAGSQLLMKCRS